MAHIPYGYKIENGCAVIISEEADRIRSLYNAFMQGLSIEASGKKAGIPLSRSAVGKVLSNPVYLGDGYYPQMVEESLYRKVQIERASRSNSSVRISSAPPAMQFQTSFRLVNPPEKEGNAVIDAQNLYDSIESLDLKEDQATSALLTPENRSERKVRCIPATTILKKVRNDETAPHLLRVAAYCRVSTDMEEQESSYEAQVRHYTEYIQSNPAWELADIYADEGISGTDTKKRDEFNRMMDNCAAGEIDLIITKSISRFARNTVDCLRSIRKLKSQQIAVYFEKENINTLDAKGEVLITIMASLAQQESQSISQNVKMGIHYQFQQGKVRLNHSCFLGYTKDSSGNLIVVQKEADIVRRIFKEFLAGKSTRKIALDLTRDGIPTASGRGRWHDSTIRSMLRNEKYMGDVLLQKTYTVDFLTKKKAKNLGELPQYYVENNHEPIISRETFQQTQGELLRREHLCSASGMREVHSCKYALSGRMICSCCGSSYRRMRSKVPTQNTIWRCKMHLQSKDACPGRSVRENEVHSVVLCALNSLASEKNEFQKRKNILLQNISSMQTEISSISQTILNLQDQLAHCITHLEMNEEDESLANEAHFLSSRLTEMQNKKREINEKKASMVYEEGQLANMLDFIRSREINGCFISETDYREEEIMLLLDQVQVLEQGYVISFKVGNTIEIQADFMSRSRDLAWDSGQR